MLIILYYLNVWLFVKKKKKSVKIYILVYYIIKYSGI